MKIEIDYNPAPANFFFISVELNKKEAISFDYTSKGKRIIKQILIEKRKFPKNLKISSKWYTLVLKNRKFIRKYHVKWRDLGKKDWVNGEIWKTAWEKTLSKKLKDELLKYSQIISNNYRKLDKFSKDVEQLEKLLSKKINSLSAQR